MNRLLQIVFFLFLSCLSIAQESSVGKKNIEYRKEKTYKGPQEWENYGPAAIRWYENTSEGTIDQGVEGINNDDAMIDRDRLKRYGQNGSRDIDKGPLLKKPEPVELPDIELPEYEGPDLLPDIDFSDSSPNFWKTLLFIFLFIAVLAGLYFWLKNRSPRAYQPLTSEELEWNPELVAQSELDRLLEKAIQEERYREAIRIYFTAILKELIRLNLIRWKKEKTNHHYQLELTGKSLYENFSKCVSVYELVWYGKYDINQVVFNELKPTVHLFYQQLTKLNVE